MNNNLVILLKDMYKAFHPFAYKPGTAYVYSNMTNRFGKYSNVKGNTKVMSIGQQAYVKEFLINRFNEFFETPLPEVLETYQKVIGNTLGKEIETSHIAALHNLGYVPLRMKGIEEGTMVPYGVPHITITNTIAGFGWLVNMLETLMSAQIWPVQTAATTAYHYKKNFVKASVETGLSSEMVPFMGHDFSYRGMMGTEAASLTGFGHLASFAGSDTIPAGLFAEKYYNVQFGKDLVMASVDATEHSVMCSYGTEGELESIEHLMDNVSPTGILSIVSDTWDFWKVVTEYLPQLKDKIMERDGTIVIRPDCYDDKTQVLTDSGFKLFKDLSDQDLVATVHEDGAYTFTKPLKYVNQNYKGKMYHFKDHHGKVDLMVTPNHRMIVERNGKEEVILAEDMLEKGNHTLTMTRSGEQDIFYRHLTNYERLMIAFQADGSYQTGTNKVRFSFSKQRKMDRLESLLNEQEISFSKYYLSDGRVEYNVNVPADDFTKDFSWVETSKVSYIYAKQFIEELSYWDATRRDDLRFKFDTTNQEVIKTVELLAIAAGYGILVSECEDSRSEKFQKVYTAHIMKNNKVGGQSWSKVEKDYEGTIHCVQVSSGKLIVKRNRCTMVCGNSGDPVQILCGYTYDNCVYSCQEEVFEKYDYEEVVPEVVMLKGVWRKLHRSSLDGRVDLGDSVIPHEVKGLIECLWDIFGGTITEQGYKLLDPHIGAIYGDSITLERQEQIIERLMKKGFVPSVVLGIGSYTYQYVTRDTHGSAVKATAIKMDGGHEWTPIFKDPKTDSKKKSAKGLMNVDYNSEGVMQLFDNVSEYSEQQGLLETIFEDGKLVKETSLTEIRERVNIQINEELGL